MAVRVLGPLDIGESRLSPRERAVLAVLVVRHGAPTAPEVKAAAYWGDSVPATWGQQVRTSIARIRRGLGADKVERVGGGYVLRIDAGSIDAVRFERLVASARGHAALAEHDRATDEYRRALALWRGVPYGEVAAWHPGAVEAARLIEIRRSVEEEWLETRLASGDHRAAIADAERLVREQPLREDRWAHLALANYRCDRQAEALAVLRTAGSRLRQELAIEPSDRIVALEAAILRQDPVLAAPAEPAGVAARAPYLGLQPFGPGDAEEFFGRGADIEAVTHRIGRGTVVVIAGPSGSGKSSLLLAGVVPWVVASGRTVLALRPSETDLLELLTDPDPVDVLAVDQAEELFTMTSGELEELGRAAASVVRGGTALVLTLRSDFLDAAARVPGLGPLLARGVFLLGPLDPGALREVIERPAERAGLFLESGLVELLLRDAGGRAEVLPYLSHALLATWERREGRTLTVAGYEASGGIVGAVARSAEQLFGELDPTGQDACRVIMVRLIERMADGAPLRRRVPWTVLAADPRRREVLERLVLARLVTADEDTVVIAHEAVARAWPRLATWLEDAAEDDRTERAVEAAATAWERAGRPDDDLMRGARLQAALEWRTSRQPALAAYEIAFLDVSAAHATAVHRQAQARADRDRRQNRRLRRILGSAVLALVAAFLGGGSAVIQARRAADVSANARIEALTATALALRDSDSDVAALLAVEAYRRWPDDPRSRSALLGVMIAAGSLVDTTWIAHADAAASALIPHRQQVLVARDRRHGEGWRTDLVTVDLDTGAVVRTFAGVTLPGYESRRKAPVSRSVTVSADGSTALIHTWLPGTDGSRLDFVDLVSGRLLGGSQTLPLQTALAVALEANGRVAYLVDAASGNLLAVDARTGRVRTSGPVNSGAAEDVARAADTIAILDRRRVAIGSADGVTIYDRDTRAPVRRIRLPQPQAALIGLMPDQAGGLLLVGDHDLLRVDLATGHVLWRRVATRVNGYGAVAPDAPRNRFFAADFDGHLDEYRLDDGQPTGRTLTSRQGQFGVPTLVDDDRELVFLDSFSPLVVRWRVDGGGPAARVEVPDLNTVDGFGAGGRMLLVQDRDRTGPERLWDLVEHRPTNISAAGLAWLGEYTLLRRGTDADDLVDARTGAARFLGNDRLTRAGGAGGAFAVSNRQLQAFDLDARTRTGPRFVVPKAARGNNLVALSRSKDRLVATWATDGSSADSLSAVWDLPSGRLLATGLRGDTRTITSDDGVVSAGLTRLVRADVDTLRVTGSLPRPDAEAQLMQVGGGILMVTTFDQRVWLYDANTGVRLGDAIPAGPTHAVPAFLAPDGSAVAVNVPEGVLLWDLDPAHQARAACRIAGRELSREEWSTYLQDLGPYRRTCGGQRG